MKRLCFLLLVTPQLFAAQALWRVDSEQAGEPMPNQERAASFFPQREAPAPKIVKKPREVQKPKAPTLTAAEVRRRERAVQASRLLSDIRQLMANEELLQPRMADVTITAYAEGSNGPRVLIENSWRGAGEVLVVPVQRTGKIVELVEQLRSFDQALAGNVEEELNEIADLSTEVSLELLEVDKEHIRLRQPDGKVHVIPVVVGQGW